MICLKFESKAWISCPLEHVLSISISMMSCMHAYKLPEHSTRVWHVQVEIIKCSQHHNLSWCFRTHKSLYFEHSKLFSLTIKWLPWERNKSKKDILLFSTAVLSFVKRLSSLYFALEVQNVLEVPGNQMQILWDLDLCPLQRGLL